MHGVGRPSVSDENIRISCCRVTRGLVPGRRRIGEHRGMTEPSSTSLASKGKSVGVVCPTNNGLGAKRINRVNHETGLLVRKRWTTGKRQTTGSVMLTIGQTGRISGQMIKWGLPMGRNWIVNECFDPLVQ